MNHGRRRIDPEPSLLNRLYFTANKTNSKDFYMDHGRYRSKPGTKFDRHDYREAYYPDKHVEDLRSHHHNDIEAHFPNAGGRRHTSEPYRTKSSLFEDEAETNVDIFKHPDPYESQKWKFTSRSRPTKMDSRYNSYYKPVRFNKKPKLKLYMTLHEPEAEERLDFSQKPILTDRIQLKSDLYNSEHRSRVMPTTQPLVKHDILASFRQDIEKQALVSADQWMDPKLLPMLHGTFTKQVENEFEPIRHWAGYSSRYSKLIQSHVDPDKWRESQHH